MFHIYIYIYIYDISSLRVNVLGGNVHTGMKNTKALIVVSKTTGLEVNSEKN